MDGLLHQRVVGHFDVAGRVFLTRGLRRKNRGEEILGAESLDRRHDALSTDLPQHREGAGRVPPPARAEHGRREQGLREEMLDIFGVQHFEERLDGKTLLRADRQHDSVVVRRRLQLEVELAAEALT